MAICSTPQAFELKQRPYTVIQTTHCWTDPLSPSFRTRVVEVPSFLSAVAMAHLLASEPVPDWGLRRKAWIYDGETMLDGLSQSLTEGAQRHEAQDFE